MPVNLDRFKNNNVWKILARIGINILIALPFAPLLFIPSSAPFAIILIFAELFLSFGVSFGLFFIGRILMRRWKVLEPVEEDPKDEELNHNLELPHAALENNDSSKSS